MVLAFCRKFVHTSAWVMDFLHLASSPLPSHIIGTVSSTCFLKAAVFIDLERTIANEIWRGVCTFTPRSPNGPASAVSKSWAHARAKETAASTAEHHIILRDWLLWWNGSLDIL